MGFFQFDSNSQPELDSNCQPPPSLVNIHIGDCLTVTDQLVADEVWFDAIICDPPYQIGYMNQSWDDAAGIVFQPETWRRLIRVLKPGGYLLAFSAARVYHHLAMAIEQAGMETYPFLIWSYPSGLPKPMNVANLFDRDNCPDRQPIGSKKGSGYTHALAQHGVQNYSKFDFPIYETNLSNEAKQWTGYYYGVNTLKPGFDPIYMGRKPIATERTIDNIRQYRTGALNVGALRNERGSYPTNVFTCAKARANKHKAPHPTVKPTDLLEELTMLVCPKGGHVLDPFAGSGSTAVACQHLGYDVTVIEIDPNMEAVIQSRLQESASPHTESAPASPSALG